MNRLSFTLLDVFTDTPLAGDPVAVFARAGQSKRDDGACFPDNREASH